MKIVEPKYEILTDISEGGIEELQQIERVARVCYKSEDKITPDGESAKKLVRFLVKQEHEAMLEHSQLSVLFTCDRGVANELVRHRIASFAQESTRYDPKACICRKTTGRHLPMEEMTCTLYENSMLRKQHTAQTCG